MKTILLAALLSLATAVPAVAGTYPLTVLVRGPIDTVTHIKVEGGTVTKPPPEREQKPLTEFTVEMTLPDGDCFKRVSFFFGSGYRWDFMTDVCRGVIVSLP